VILTALDRKAFFGGKQHNNLWRSYTMAYSMDTILGDVLANPAAIDLMDSIIPGTSKNPMIKMAKGFTLGKIAKTPAAKIPEAKIQEFIDAANAKGL
jgi:hypothetical protein